MGQDPKFGWERCCGDVHCPHRFILVRISNETGDRDHISFTNGILSRMDVTQSEWKSGDQR